LGRGIKFQCCCPWKCPDEDALREEVADLIALDNSSPRSILMSGMDQPVLVPQHNIQQLEGRTPSLFLLLQEQPNQDAARKEVGDLIVLDNFSPRTVLVRSMDQPMLIVTLGRPCGASPNARWAPAIKKNLFYVSVF
jgi:hypothetical protein